MSTAAATPSIAVLVADDDPIVREALRGLLSRSPGIEVVAVVEDGAAVVEYARVHRVDVFLLDMRMPVLDGLSTVMALRDVAPDAASLLMTSSETPGAAQAAVAAGARGFLVKTTPPRELVLAIREAADRVPRTAPPGQEVAPAAADGEDLLPLPLTRREREILQLLCDARTNHEIARALHLSEATVKSHVTAIMAKLHVTTRLKAVVVALRHNICKL